MTDDDIVILIKRDPRAADAAFMQAKSTIDFAVQRRTTSRLWSQLANDELQSVTAHRPVKPAYYRATPHEQAAAMQYQVALVRIADDVVQAFAWLDNLNPAEKFRAESAPQGPVRETVLREIGKRSPIIVRWVERADDRARKFDEANARATAASDAAWRAGAPQRVLDAVEAAGAVLTIGKDGKGIFATETGAVTATMVSELKVHKAAVISLLAARDAAKAPILLA